MMAMPRGPVHASKKSFGKCDLGVFGGERDQPFGNLTFAPPLVDFNR